MSIIIYDIYCKAMISNENFDEKSQNLFIEKILMTIQLTEFNK